MKNKKGIMFFSSLLILIFHLWINIFDRTSNLYTIENFIRQICFIGVDIFFFLSAYSIANIKDNEYKKFIKSRVIKIYIPFLIFAIIALFYMNWDIKTFMFNILGINLFLKGGGSFLWFIPAIMLVYLLLPLYNRLEKKHIILVPCITIILWITLTIFLSLNSSYNHVFIFTNRIPILLLGYYFKKMNTIDKLSKKNYLMFTSILIIAGILILYNYRHLNVSFIKDIFYILGIPLTLGCILLVNLIPTNKFINILGSITLEMYGVQMIFGYKITEFLLSINNHLLTDILTLTSIILISLIMHHIFKLIISLNNQ